MATATFINLLTTLCFVFFAASFFYCVGNSFSKIIKLFLIKRFFSASWDHDCDTNGQYTIERTTEGNVSGYHVLTFVNYKNNYPGHLVSCLWNFTQETDFAKPHWLDLNTVVLDADDQVVVTGYVLGDSQNSPFFGYEGYDQRVLEETLLYDSKGSHDSGLVYLSGYRFVNVKLNLAHKPQDPASVSRRAFTAVYYWNSAVVLSQSARNGTRNGIAKEVEGGNVGKLIFPLNNRSRVEALNATLELTVSKMQNDHLILINFTQLPKNITSGTVSINGGAPLKPSSTRVYLQSSEKDTVSITLNSISKTEQISLRYWLVNKNCSKNTLLKVDEPAQAILIPNREFNENFSAVFRCAMLYSTNKGDNLLLHSPSSISLANVADQLYVYDHRGQVVLGLNNFAATCFSVQDTIIETSTAAVLYESPYFSPPNANFQIPTIKAIPTQGNFF